MKPRKTIIRIGGVICAIALTACATNEPIGRTQVGVAVGAVTGAILGHQIDDDRGRLLGAAVGAIAGAAVGNYMDEQQAALEEQLRQEREAEAIEITRVANDTLRLNVNSEVSFAVNSALISAQFYNSLNKVSGVLGDYEQTVVHIIGHTDSTGPDSYNQKLSEERANNVRRYLASQGITNDRVVAEGRGELSPIADNNTEAGRGQNRRVEILLKTIVEGQESNAFEIPAS